MFQRDRIIRNLEIFQDIIVISLSVGLFAVMLLRLGDLFFSLTQPRSSQQLISDILFILIMVELFRLSVIYLQERQISLGAAVEVTIVSALREVILRGILEIPRDQVIGICIFLLVLGGLWLVRDWTPNFFQKAKIGTSESVSEDASLPQNKLS